MYIPQKFICKYVLAYLVKETFHYLNEPLKKYAALNDPATGNRQVCNWSDFNAGRWAYDSRRYAATCYFEMN